jgi:Glycosyl hydrolases family 2, TIM barrel domain
MFTIDRVVVLAAFLVFPSLNCFNPAPARAAATDVQLRSTDQGWSLFRDGQPFFIQGAGGDASREILKECGGNSFRLWGADGIDRQLDEANRLGLAVTVGIWLEHAGGPKHFDYNNPKMVAHQLELVRDAILRYKDNPAVLVWGLGNEMEGYKNGDDPAIWHAVQDAAALAHKLDPRHPTMTVIAEIGGKRVQSIDQYCPDIDIIGINTYAGGPSVASRYRAMGGTKPFILTEFGPAGTWEVGLNSWHAPIEATSTAKADFYRDTYNKTVLPERGKLCLGSYAFLWGNKQEATATWFGMFLPDGSRLESVDEMTELWTGHAPESSCPRIQPVVLDRNDVDPGETIHATLDVTDPANNPLTAKWVLTRDQAVYQTAGAFQASPKTYADAVVSSDIHGAQIHMPADVGPYWLYAYVYDGKGGAATSVVPMRVHAHSALTTAQPADAPGQAVQLPFVIYGTAVRNPPYTPSGWMGDANSLAIDEKCAQSPHSGDFCMKCQFKAVAGFGGIAWQNPANDWGNQPGGFNLTGASKLTFWARGEEGNEDVTFKLGILGADKKYSDSDHAELPDVVLTKEWKQYTIDLSGKNLACIKTGFVWVLAANGKPVTFYLDDIQYE